MRLGPKIITLVSILLAAAGVWIVATVAADVIEKRSGEEVRLALIEAGHDWVEVHTDGLQLHLGGNAPTEAERFNALHVAGSVVDASRIIDGTVVAPSEPLTPPDFSIEILRNDEGVTLIGLVPATMDRALMVNEITALAQGAEVTDLLQAASYPEPEGWAEAVHFGLNVLARLSRSKISISPGKVQVTAISSSAAEKRELEGALTRRIPRSVQLVTNITAPRPVIAPFTLRFLIDENGPHFDACSADDSHDRDRILAAAAEAGMQAQGQCSLGLGTPSREWANAVIQGIRAVGALEGGSVTYSDTDVTLVALEGTPQRDFDRVVGELESNLPEGFSLHSVLPEPVRVDGTGAGDGPPEFIATLSPEGQLQLRGRLNNEMVRETVDSFAQARFGVAATYMAARIDETLPAEWPIRVLAGLQALSELENGSAIVQEDYLEMRGKTGNQDAAAEIARIFADKLGEGQNFKIDVTYEETLDPLAALPTAEECVAKVNAHLAESKITFEPGSAELDAAGIGVLNDIAEILKACREVAMEIEVAGYTDSQGREEMNLNLSQSRADAVVDALLARRVLASRLTAQGYGESDPVADNDTEEGREANRRIEFRLLQDDTEDAAGEDADASGGSAAAPDPDGTTGAGDDSGEAGPDAPDAGQEAAPTEAQTDEAAETRADAGTGTAGSAAPDETTEDDAGNAATAEGARETQ